MQEMENEKKRLFFGLSVESTWPMTYPKGRITDEKTRHITFGFLGTTTISILNKGLATCPKPDFIIGPAGRTDRLLFLPEYRPRVVAHHVKWLSCNEKLASYYEHFLNWLQELGFSVDRRPLLPHVTIARRPFDEKEWEKAFEPLPLIVTGLHLYASIGNLRYQSLWCHDFLPAFEEVEHTADIAFNIRGETYFDLYQHAGLALCFKYPPLLAHLRDRAIENLDGCVKTLNEMISFCDEQIGCPFKAVSYHGKLEDRAPLSWEMIVDV